MDWQLVREALCAGRRFTPTQPGYSALADTMMPSGASIEIFMQPDHEFLKLHDNGAAFDELARTGREIRSMSGLRRIVEASGCRLSPNGQIFLERLEPEKVSVGVAILADCSLRSALYLIEHSAVVKRDALDARVKEALRAHFPSGRPNWTVQGAKRQHRFDFGLELDGETVVVQTVTPYGSSISSAIVKGLDARKAPNSKIRPILVYDAEDHWSGENLAMLAYGGEPISSVRALEGKLNIAA